MFDCSRVRRSERGGSALVLALLVACGNGSSPSDGPAGRHGPPSGDSAIDDKPSPSSLGSIDALIDYSIRAYCAAIYHCSVSLDDELTNRELLESEPRCVELYRTYVEDNPVGQFEALKRLQAEGRVRVDGEAARACIDAWRTPCAAFTGFLGSTCREAIEGDVAVGGPCNQTLECAGDAYCEITDSCPGRCTAPLPVGSACARQEQCEQGGVTTRCEHVENTGTCVSVAVTIAGEGEPCRLSEGPPALCSPGLWCSIPEDSADRSGVCRQPIAAGAACARSTDVCEPGSLCFGSDGARSCKAVRRLQEGDTCAQSEQEPVFCDVLERLQCGASGTCERLGDGSLGSRCAGGDAERFAPCDGGLYCHSESHSCVALEPAGANCDSDDQCVSGACSMTDSTCRESYCQG